MLIAGLTGVFRTARAAGWTRLRRIVVVLLACTGVGQVVCGLFALEAVMPHMLGSCWR